MATTYVKNGTPVGQEHLCKSCTWGLVISGYRESEVIAFCTQTNPSFRLPFVVYRCTEYQDKNRPDWKQMEKLAIEIAPVRISKKVGGFTSPDPQQPEKPEYEPVIPRVEAGEEDDNELGDTAVAATR